jgi:hypothetical protein
MESFKRIQQTNINEIITPLDPASITISRVEYDNLVGIWVVAQTVFISSTNNHLSSVWPGITSLFGML